MNHLKETKIAEPNLVILENIFNYISEISNAKELVLGILEQFDPMVELEIVEMLLPPLKIGN